MFLTTLESAIGFDGRILECLDTKLFKLLLKLEVEKIESTPIAEKREDTYRNLQRIMQILANLEKYVCDTNANANRRRIQAFQQGNRTPEDHTAFAGWYPDRLMKEICSTVMKALASSDFVISNLASQLVNTEFFLGLLTTEDGRLGILNKEGWKLLKRILTSPSTYDDIPQIVVTVDGKVSDPFDNLRQNVSNLIRSLSSLTLKVDSSLGMVVVGEVGIKLIQKGFIKMIIDSFSDVDKETKFVCLATYVLAELTRAKDVRLMLLNEEKSRKANGDESFIGQLMKLKAPDIISPLILLIVHLLWDDEWQDLLYARDSYISPMPIEIWLARWTAGCIHRIENEARYSWDLLQIRLLATNESRNKPLPKGMKKYAGGPERRTHFGGPGLHYPDKDIQKHFQKAALLSRCVLLSDQLITSGGILKRLGNDELFLRCKTLEFHELDVACIDFPGYEFSEKCCASLTHQLSVFRLKPEDFHDADDFIDNLFAWVLDYGDYHERNQSGCLTLVRTLYGHECWNVHIKKFLKRTGKYTEKHHKKLLKHFEQNKITLESTGEDFASFFQLKETEKNASDSNQDNEESNSASWKFNIEKNTIDPTLSYISAQQQTLIGLRQCSHCEKLEDKKGDHKACSGCRDRYYCNRDCLLADWKAGHRSICKTLKQGGGGKGRGIN